jgi:lysophospholipase L1-like esterase
MSKLVLVVMAAFHCAAVLAADPAGKSPFSKWESVVQKFEQQDEADAPPKGAILFVGSSSIRLWKLDDSFPELKTINRGFGGSEIADSNHFADRLILKHEPRIVVLYAGDNDIAKGKSAETVTSDFRQFVKTVHDDLPETRIVFIAIKPSIKRWNLVKTVRAANAAIHKLCEQDQKLSFADIDTPMIGDDGRPRAELFAKDGLHLNADGYRVWTKVLTPLLVERQ